MNTHLIIAFLAAVTGVGCAVAGLWVLPSASSAVGAPASWGLLAVWIAMIHGFSWMVVTRAGHVSFPVSSRPFSTGPAAQAVTNATGWTPQISPCLQSLSSVRIVLRRAL